MNQSTISKFSVYGLFGTDDVHILFDENVKIFIGENGLGKTQILNIFYHILIGNFSKLNEFSFSMVELTLADKIIKISKDEILLLHKSNSLSPLIERIINLLGEKQYERLLFDLSKRSPSRLQSFIENHTVYRHIRRFAPLEYVIDSLLNEVEKRNIQAGLFTIEKSNSNEEIKEVIKKLQIYSQITYEFLMSNTILYFPTYRRVEEDLHNLGYDDDDDDDEFLENEDTLIRFGMGDVQARFTEIENNINDFIITAFSNFSSQLVDQFFKDEETQEALPDTDYLNNIDENDIEILLSRIGTKISDFKKNKIKQIVKKKEINQKDSSLNLLFKNLIDNYSPQKQLDNSVKEFRDICNNYLVNKEVFFDESEIKIYIKSKRNGSKIDLDKLSSGEKQVISLFSRIYLSKSDKRFIVLFDEPELSLSMKWQRQLLPDILKSEKCDFLLAVTHSPFIFENELDKYAVGLNEFITPSQPKQEEQVQLTFS